MLGHLALTVAPGAVGSIQIHRVVDPGGKMVFSASPVVS